MMWLVVIAIVLALVYWYGMCNYSLVSHLQGPEPYPFIGNIPDIIKNGTLHKTIHKFYKRYGRVYKFCIGRTPTIIVNDPEIARQILVKQSDKFPDRPLFVKSAPPMDKNMFVVRGATWKRIRTILTPTFSSSKLKQLVPIIESSSNILSDIIEKHASKGKSVDCYRLFAIFALDVIMKSAFGYETDVQSNPDDELIRRGREVFKIPLWKRAFSMFPFADRISTLLKLNAVQNTDYFLRMALDMIHSRQVKGTTGRRDLLQLMLEAHDSTVNGASKLSDEELAVQATVFLIAGFETTGNTLSYTAYYLATHPDIQDRLLEELDKAHDNRGDTSLYDFCLSHEYLDRVLCEVLRLCPPAFMHLRHCDQDCVIEGIHFPKGVDVSVAAWNLHRDPEAWEYPEEFYPDHFTPEAKLKRHAFSYEPFSMGPRQCIGMRFALTELKICLVTILKKFKLERAPDTAPLDLEGALLLQPTQPIMLRIRKR
ncbi:cytochrome P450 3A16 [Nematostella vectensis]|uniref:cytochrome P450 3A16 n=1 Tax=Nematostella vectensis TaxID=45351 RepID=UPI002076ED5D|nr:cytochrome P450 3A16 [Nematostella vectensis]